MPAFPNSTNLQSAEYDPETRVLSITFKRGVSYSYADVDEATYNSLLSAGSPGAYFAANIRDKFSYQKG